MKTAATLFALMGSAAAIGMAELKQRKMEAWAAQNEAGVYDINRYAAQAATSCVNGKAGEYQCKNVDLVSFLRHQDMGSSTRKGNDIWGKRASITTIAATAKTQANQNLNLRMDLLHRP